MKNLLIMLAVATIPIGAGGCNCCGIGTCPCNPCNWFSRGAYCGPATPTYAPVMASPCPPSMVPAVMPQYATPFAAPYAAAPMAGAPMVGSPMIADPSTLGYMQAQPMAYGEPGCGYVEPGCGYPGTVGYGPSMPMGYGGCCEGGSYDGAVMSTPTESFVDPAPANE